MPGHDGGRSEAEPAPSAPVEIQPEDARNDWRQIAPVSGLFLTGMRATSTCLLIARAYFSSRRCGRMAPCGGLRRGL